MPGDIKKRLEEKLGKNIGTQEKKNNGTIADRVNKRFAEKNGRVLVREVLGGGALGNDREYIASRYTSTGGAGVPSWVAANEAQRHILADATAQEEQRRKNQEAKTNAMREYDSDVGKANIDKLEADVKRMEKLSGEISSADKWLSDYEKKNKEYQQRYKHRSKTLTERRATLQSELDGITSGYDGKTLDVLQKELNEARVYHDAAKKFQAIDRLTREALEAEDFENYSTFKDTKSGEDADPTPTSIRHIQINNPGGAGMKLFEKYKYMDPEEVKVYNYYYTKYGEEKAEEYLKAIDSSLINREAVEISKQYNDTWVEPFLNFGGGVERFGANVTQGAWHAITGNEEDLVQYSPTTIASEIAMSDNKGLWKVANDLSSTTGNMLPSILVGTINPIAGTATMGVGSAGQAYNDMISLGYSKNQARGYAFLVGASESTLQYFLGGIGKLGGKATGGVAAKAVTKLDNALAKLAIKHPALVATIKGATKLGISSAGEATEEGLQVILEPLFKSWAANEAYLAPDFEEVAYNALLGALSAYALEGPSTIVSDTAAYVAEKRAKKYAFGVTQTDIDSYVDAAYENSNTIDFKKYAEVSPKLAADVSPEIDLTGYAHALRDNDIRHIRNSHGENTNEKYPVTKQDIKNIPWVIENYDKVFTKTNAKGKPGIVYVKVGADNVVYYVEAVTTEYHGEKMLVNKQMIKTGIDEIPNLHGLEAAINKKESSSQYLADLQEIRKAYVQDVKENRSNNIVPQPSQIVKGIDNDTLTKDMSAQAVEAMRSGVEAVGEENAGAWAIDFREAYTAGRMGVSMPDASQSTSVMTDGQRSAAYELGVAEAKASGGGNVNTSQNANTRAVERASNDIDTDLLEDDDISSDIADMLEADNTSSANEIEGRMVGMNTNKTGKVSDTELSARKSRAAKAKTETARTGYLAGASESDIHTAEYLSKVFGRKIIFISNDYTINGKFAEDTVFINPESDDVFETVVMHELTHSVEGTEAYGKLLTMLKEYSAEKYGENYWDELVVDNQAEYKDSYKEKTGQEYTDARAERDVAARMLSSFFGSDGRELAEIEADVMAFAKQNRTAVSRMWYTLKRAAIRIKQDIADARARKKDGYDAEARERQLMLRKVEDMRDMLAKALREAKAGKTSGEGGFSFVKVDKNGVREYKTDFGDDVSRKAREEFFKKHIRSVINLGQIRLKTDTKKFVVVADKFTKTKNIGGDNVSTPQEYNAKIDALYDMADILNSSEFDYKKAETSYDSSTNMVRDDINPKNPAHNAVKYWYYFTNTIKLDGVEYDVVFNIRDKGKTQTLYFIEFKNKETVSGNNHTANKSLRSAVRQTPSNNSISQKNDSVNTEFSFAKGNDGTKARTSEEERNRIRAIERLKGGEDPETVYEQTGWYEDKYGNLVVDHEAPVYLDENNTSERGTLAKMAMAASSNPGEREVIQKYIADIDAMDAQEQKLNGLKKELKEIYFSKGKRDMAKIREIRDEITKTQNRIDNYDKRLLNTEALAPIKRLFDSERKKLTKNISENAKAVSNEKLEAQKQYYQDMRERDREAHRASKLRENIKRSISETRKALRRGLKTPNNVKEELREPISQVLDFADAIMTEKPSNEQIAALDLVPTTDAEDAALMRYRELLADREAMSAMTEEEYEAEYGDEKENGIYGYDDSAPRIEKNIIDVARMDPVSTIEASKLQKSGKRPSEIFKEYFDEWDNSLYSEELGEIALPNSSVKSEIRHGITAEKIASIEAIPDVISQGKVIFSETKAESDVKRVVVCAPISIGEKPYYMGVMLQRDNQNQRLYLHNVAIVKETSELTQADLHTTGALASDEHLFMTSILQNALAVKYQSNNVSADFDGDAVKAEIMQRIKIEGELDKLVKTDLKEMFSRKRAELARTKSQTLLSQLSESYGRLADSEHEYIASAYDEVVHNMIKALAANEGIASKRLSEMNSSELEAVQRVFTAMRESIYNSNRCFTNAMKGKLSERVVEFARAVTKNSRNYEGLGPDVRDRVVFNLMKPVYAFRRIAGKVGEAIFNELLAAQDTYAVDVDEAAEFMKKARRDHHFNKWDHKAKFKFSTILGTLELDLGEIMSIYALSNREQSSDHMTIGGVVKENTAKKLIKKIKKQIKESGGGDKLDSLLPAFAGDASAYQLDKSLISEITSKLTPEQRAFVDVTQAYLSDVMGAKGNEVSMKLYGVKLFGEKFYFPIRSAKQFLRTNFDGQTGEVRIKNKGMTNEVVAHANNPIVIGNYMDIWASHVNEMSLYHSFTLPLEDLTRLYNYNFKREEGYSSNSVKAHIENCHGKDAEKYIETLIRDINGGAVVESAGVWGQLVSKHKKASVMAKLTVAVQQPTAIVRAMAYIDPKYFVGVSKPTPKQHRETWAELKKYCPVAIVKEIGGIDINTSGSIIDHIAGNKGVLDYVDDVAGWGAKMGDEFGWCAIWKACKREAMAKNKNLKGDELCKAAATRFNEVINLTQVYDSVLSRSQIMRSKNAVAQMTTSFMAEPTTTINMLYDAASRTYRGEGDKLLPKVIAATFISNVLADGAYAFAAAVRDDDDSAYLEKVLSRFKDRFLDTINPLTYFPYARDIWSLVQNYDVERMDMALIGDLISSLRAFSNDEKTQYEKISGVVGSVANIFGVPVANLEKEVRGFVNTLFPGVNFGNGAAKYSTSDIGKSLEKGNMSRSTEILNELINSKVESGSTLKEARASVKSGVTRYAKEIYREAHSKGDMETKRELYRWLVSTKLYGNSADVADMLADWLREK